MRLPDPIANTTTEAYLAYKAGVLAEGDLKPKLYEPYIHLDAWLAYWAGLTESYPVKNVGKNLFDKNTDVLNGNYYLPGNIASTRIVTANSSTMARTLLIRLQEGQTYTIQKKVSARFRFGFTTTNNPAPDTDGVITSRLAGPDTSASVTFTVPKGSPYFVCNFFSDDQAADAQNGYDTIVDSIQIEAGSQATTYAPYFEPIELCKLGTYQDYIWKDGEDWKIHKATKKNVYDGSIDEAWALYQGNNSYWGFYIPATDSISASPSYSNRLVNKPDGSAWGAGENTYRISPTLNMTCALVPRNSQMMTLAEWKAYLANNNMVVCYSLATPTDTIITDTDLIAQLEAIRTASLENDTNTITNSTPEPNLAGDMEVGYYGYNPRNRYDKFIWLDLNNNYEQIGS